MCCALSIGSPRISGLGGVESRWSLGGVDNIVRGLRSRVRGQGQRQSRSYKAEFLRRYQNFMKRSRESDQVVDSIFELKIIHVHAEEVAYMQSRAIGG
jgi:hypothetical protein